MLAVLIFIGLVGFMLSLSWFFGRKSKTADGYFIAGGQVNWFINGIALTGGYLSAASFLGICGMIAFKGFDGFLYSMGFLSGWVVALFVVAEPLRRLGKYTFADALGARFESKNIHLAASISTLVISIFYLVPQMVGAGVLIEPLLGIAHHWGVIIVGAVVMVVVVSAGMASTTYVQFVKASTLIIFSFVLVLAIGVRGFDSRPDTRDISGGVAEPYQFQTLTVPGSRASEAWDRALADSGYVFKDSITLPAGAEGEDSESWILLERALPLSTGEVEGSYTVVNRGQTVTFNGSTDGVTLTEKGGRPHIQVESWWFQENDLSGAPVLKEAQDMTVDRGGLTWVNGLPSSPDNSLLAMGRISRFGSRSGHSGEKGWVGPFKLLAVFADPDTRVEVPVSSSLTYEGKTVSLFRSNTVAGNILMRPGGNFKLGDEGTFWSRLDFVSLMLALFLGTASLPHVLIRYYTVKDSTAARKSTIVAISAIGLFYILTLFLGLGAIANGVLNPLSDNMSAPLLARAFGEVLFAIITALAFATVLGTVAGLIVAASGAVANDLMEHFLKIEMTGRKKIVAARVTSISVGVIAVILGILFKGINVGFLVGWAFAVAASANFPAIIMVLFWKKTTPAGIVSSIFVGIGISMGIILLGPDMFQLYGLGRANALIPLGQPAIFSMPLSFLTVVLVSRFTQPRDPKVVKSEVDLTVG
jgi:cation/acetate symporter